MSTLSLVNGNLSYLSSSINKLINLQELYLDDNLIQLVPDSISELVNLKVLSLSRNMISRMPMLQLPLLKKLLIGSNHLSNLEFLVGCLQLEEISAFNNAIQHFPQGISCLTNLQTLNLHHNNFYHIPNNLLSHLTNLTDLDFSCTAIESIPISIGLLVQLSKLNLSDNHISNIQSNVFRPSITKLDLSRNNITTLSHNFAYLTQLTYLDIQCNKIEIIPQSMKNCSLLKNLNVSGNCLKGIPIWMMKMIKLEKLVLSKNEISCLASVIGNLTSLKELYLEDNKLNILPHSIDSLNNLEKLCLSGNPLNPKFLPQALIDVPSTKEVVDQIKECGKKYYADIQIPTKRMQIMVMGQEGSGKTALVRSLCYKWEVSEALPDNGVGIAITKVITNKKQNEKTISLELWDFSASSIEAYYATHRFFLHSWCVYVLLYNLSDPQAASKLGYWIHSIAIQVPKAKILIIATHTDIKSDKKWDLNILKQKFNSLHPGITFLKSFSVVSIVEDNNMMELRRYVRNISLEILQSNETQMDILNSKSFLQFEQVVKEYKSSLPIPIVSYDEIVSICYLCNITKISDTLMNYHKLGLLLYFGMSKDLRDFVILDPQWLYGEMAKLFIEGQTQEYGILDLSKLSLSAKPEYIKTKLLQLIAKFQIGFLFNGKENFSYLYETKQVGRSIRALFVPELIKKLDCPMDLNQFKQCLKSMHQINRSFKFNFIPIGLFPRLMTAVLQLLSPSVVTLWRRGIVFELKRANRVVSGLLENNFYDFLVAKESNNSTNLFEFIGEKMENLITLELISGDLDLLCETFYWILELIITVSSDWNQKFTMYWHPSDTSPVSIEEMKKLNLNQANKDLPGKIDWGTAIPEVVLPTYQGKRYLPDDIKTTEEIARGAYGIVFLGIVEYKQVAIKEIFLNDETEQEILIRLKLINEIVLHSRLKHPNIVNLEGICWESRRIVFELCTLGNLHQQIVDLNFHFSWKYRVRILTDIMKGVHYLHSLPIPVIHRDLKSLNIMIISTHPTDPINAKITDFGTATYYTHPLTTRVVDNPSWLAPEIIEKKEYGLASDIYAFGMVAWETFCRELPFLLKWGEVEEKVLAGERPPLPSESPALFNELLNECWHQVPSSRPSPTDIIKKLGEIDQLDNIEEDNIAFQRRKKRNSLPVFLAGSRIPRQDSQNKSKIQRKGARVL
uniref:non-specific serine/threonine protein kinase n=1 Tax=Arcella intermedia TaxID=1963864 RepID=A0A6B2KX09_9EUKA